MWALALGLAAGSAACSKNDGRRDRNYGTDAGANYQLPDGTLDRSPETAGADLQGEAGAEADTPGGDAPTGGEADAAPFQDTGEAADAETGG